MTDEFFLDTPLVRSFFASVRAQRRHTYDPDSGAAQPFRSGYANAPCEPAGARDEPC